MRFTHLAEFSEYAKYQPFKFYLLIFVIACFPVTYACGPPHLRLHGRRIRNADRRAGQDSRALEHQHDAPLRQILRDGHRPRDGGFRRAAGVGGFGRITGRRGLGRIDTRKRRFPRR